MQLPSKNLPGISKVKFLLIVFVIVFLSIGGYFGYNYLIAEPVVVSNISENQNDGTESPQVEDINTERDLGIINDENSLTSGTVEKNALQKLKEAVSPSDKTRPFNILVLGIDRRHGNQTSWRTDVIQLVTLSSDRKRAVVTHIPRDVWAENYKINAVYNLQGPDAIKDTITMITGQRPDRIIRIDFDAFVYAVDMVGGVNINNPNQFTDSGYPDDRNGSDQAIEISFPKGEQELDGEKALQYVRSRKGTNGEGSDYARGRRQQVVMKAILADFFTSNSINPKTAETLYKIATEKIYTDLNLADTQILFELLKNYKDIQINTLSLDTTNYLEVPADSSPYGGHWVLKGKGDSYVDIQKKISELILPPTSQ